MKGHGTVACYKRGCRRPECREAIRLERAARRELAAANGGVYPGPITHGVRGSYGNYGCRCRECTDAYVTATTKRRTERWALSEANGGTAPIEVHDVWTYFNWGCHCDVCLNAHNEYEQGLRKARRKRVPRAAS